MIILHVFYYICACCCVIDIITVCKMHGRETSRFLQDILCIINFWFCMLIYREWRTKCHTIDCARNTFLLLQKHLTSGTKLILIGWKIVPNEEHVQCDHRFASQPLANQPLHSSQLFDTSLQKARGTTSLCGP